MPHNDSEARPHDPETPGEWQEAIDAAEFFLAVDSAEKYGLITGPAVKLERALRVTRARPRSGDTRRRRWPSSSGDISAERFLLTDVFQNHDIAIRQPSGF
jgi:hypothetical protein